MHDRKPISIDPAAPEPDETPAPRRAWPARLWRWSGHPIATLAMLGLLWFVAVRRAPDTSGAWPTGGPRLAAGQPAVPYATVVRGRAGAIGVVDLNKIGPGEQDVGCIYYAYRARGPVGIGPAWELEGIIVSGSGMTEAEIDAARVQYVRWLARHPDAYWRAAAARLPGGANVVTSGGGKHLLWLLSVAALAGLLVRSLAWTIPAALALSAALGRFTIDPVERARRKRRAALARGECPVCGYGIRALPERRCPECAEVWTTQEAGLVNR